EILDAEVQKGNLSLEDAQEQVKKALIGEKEGPTNRQLKRNLDLGENGYVFILDQDGTFLVHPFSEGNNEWEVEDESGLKFIQEMINIGSDGGIVYYDWPLPDDESVIAPKITYSKTDPNWDWVINASTYEKDFNEPAKEVLKTV